MNHVLTTEMFLKDQLYEKIFAEADRICANGTNEKSLEGKGCCLVYGSRILDPSQTQ